MENYTKYITETNKSFIILKRVLDNSIITVNNKGIIQRDFRDFFINDKKILIHNQDTVNLRRNNKELYQYLNFYETYIHRNFIISTFLKKEKVIMESERYDNDFIFYFIKDKKTNNIITSFKSRINSGVKFVSLIQRYYKIDWKEELKNVDKYYGQTMESYQFS